MRTRRAAVSDEPMLRSAARAAARLAKQVELGLADVDLSAPQYRMLGLLAAGAAGASALVKPLAVTPPSITALVDGLAARGLVERQPDPHDRRRHQLVLTEEGSAVLARADRAVAERLQAIATHADEPATLLAQLARWQTPLDEYREARVRAKQ